MIELYRKTHSMITLNFEMYHCSTTQPVKVHINIDDEFWFTSIDGNFKGSFVVDKNDPIGYSTEDAELKEYLEGIGMYLRDNDAKHHLADLLMKKYGDNLKAFQFTNNDILELVADEDTDIEEFGACIKDHIYDDVAFESKLSVVLSKEGDDYTVDFDIN